MSNVTAANNSSDGFAVAGGENTVSGSKALKNGGIGFNHQVGLSDCTAPVTDMDNCFFGNIAKQNTGGNYQNVVEDIVAVGRQINIGTGSWANIDYSSGPACAP